MPQDERSEVPAADQTERPILPRPREGSHSRATRLLWARFSYRYHTVTEIRHKTLPVYSLPAAKPQRSFQVLANDLRLRKRPDCWRIDFSGPPRLVELTTGHQFGAFL